ncbi:2TM domain-containing protein [uncultured Eudoraea sp.]|uniref:2TM domain-containing protein n=1 Tax=uncultured Eudoraea sp. TaxID=1035614 RepID=UPI0026177A91|nr:2TM domain-containing protein [uncultured Eudoraea sp.]
MFSKNKSEATIDREQHEQLEYAHKRIKQKKNLYVHFVLFLIGSVFLILINKILKYGEEYNWFIWAITFWAFLFVVHIVNVYVTEKFMGIDWEREQREKLIAKQRQRIKELQNEIETDFPMTNYKKKD